MQQETDIVIDQMTSHRNLTATEDDRPATGRIRYMTSDWGAFLHVVRSCIGAGMMAMPYAFRNAGLIFGGFGAAFAGFTVAYTTGMLVDCAQKLGDIYNRDCMSFADTADYAFCYGFKGRFKRHACKARCLVNLFLFSTYYGCLMFYVLLISSTVKQLTEQYFQVDVDLRLYVLGLIIVIYPLSIIRFFKHIVPFSAVANVLLVGALVLIFFEICQDLPSISSRIAVQSPIKWPMFFGATYICMEGIGTVLPLENEMKNPRHLTNWPWILYWGMLVTVAVNTGMGFFGYLKYGEDIMGVVSLNLPENWLSETVKAMIALIVLLTYGLQLTTPVKVVWDGVVALGKNSTKHYYIVRSAVIITNVLFAAAIPSLGGILSLVGSTGTAFLVFLCPAIIEIFCLSGENLGVCKWRLIKNLLLIFFAVISAILGAYSNVMQILQDLGLIDSADLI